MALETRHETSAYLLGVPQTGSSPGGDPVPLLPRLLALLRLLDAYGLSMDPAFIAFLGGLSVPDSTAV